MSSRPLLNGQVDDGVSAANNRIRELLRENERLRDLQHETAEELERVRLELLSIKRPTEAIKKKLAPFFTDLKNLFQELDQVPTCDYVGETGAKKAGVWEAWKSKLGGKQAEFIEALLVHGEMTREQLRISTKSGQSTTTDIIGKLRNLSLIENRGGKWALKEL